MSAYKTYSKVFRAAAKKLRPGMLTYQAFEKLYTHENTLAISSAQSEFFQLMKPHRFASVSHHTPEGYELRVLALLLAAEVFEQGG